MISESNVKFTDSEARRSLVENKLSSFVFSLAKSLQLIIGNGATYILLTNLLAD